MYDLLGIRAEIIMGTGTGACRFLSNVELLPVVFLCMVLSSVFINA
jgi:hypothetical protein